MTKTDRFESIAQLREEKLRLDATRRLHRERLVMHWEALGDKEVRQRMIKGTVSEAIGSWKPARILGKLIGGGSVTSSIGLMMSAKKAGWAKKAALFALGMVAPSMLKRVEKLSVPDILHEVNVSIGNVREHLRERKEERAAN